ncbi:MAG: toprim domain-containing protein [Bacilli bacterium]|nr:toprim domain-containing protein [Bacilli bacterium]
MNKINIDAVIVVEGKTDVSYLSAFINSYFFVTNGYDINDEKIQFLKLVSSVKKIIILTDPDEAGKNIREKIKNQINSAVVVEIEKNSRKNYMKSGVAESNISYIINALNPFKTTNEIVKYNYNLSNLISLDENPENIRKKIITKYRLINGNNKSLENQLNMLGIKPGEIL